MVFPGPHLDAVSILDLYEQVLSLPGAPDAYERHKLIHDAIRIHIDEGPFMLGIVGEPTIPGVIKNNFKKSEQSICLR